MDIGDPRCPFCGREAGLIYVASHYQCAACGQIVDACCSGEVAWPTSQGERHPGDSREPRRQPWVVTRRSAAGPPDTESH